MFGNFLVMLRKDSIVAYISLLRVDSKTNDGLNNNAKMPKNATDVSLP